MKKHLYMLFACVLACACAHAGQGRELSAQETDAAINNVFNGAAGVTRLECDLITQKTGGMVKGSQISYEFLRLETPSRMVLLNRGASQERIPLEQMNIILVDGRNIWEVEPRQQRTGQRSVSRRQFRPSVPASQSQGLAVFIGLFLMGREVASATGLREEFNIVCYDEPIPNRPETTLHFTLTPRRGGETLELWILPGHALPWKVRSFERKEIKFPPPKPGEPPRYKLEDTTRVLRNVRTNLNGLQPFTAETFLLPLAADMNVRDEQTNQVMSAQAVQAELAEVRREYMAQPR